MAEGSVILPDDLPEEVKQGSIAEHVYSSTELDVSERLYQSIIKENKSFWSEAYKPFMDRKISRADMMRFLERVYREGGCSYKGMARILGIENEYRKLFNALYHHDLRIKDGS
jgi:hypothetical protein